MRISDWSSDVCSSDLPGNKQPEEGVDGGRNSSRTEAQAIGGNRPVRKADSHEFFPTHSSRTKEYGAQWNKHDQCEPDQAEAEREAKARNDRLPPPTPRSEAQTSELQSLMPNPYAVFCLKKKKHTTPRSINQQ